jgi:hypothetical protein
MAGRRKLIKDCVRAQQDLSSDQHMLPSLITLRVQHLLRKIAHVLAYCQTRFGIKTLENNETTNIADLKHKGWA